MVCVNNDLASWLNQRLNERNLSQRELARRAGISHATVSQVLSNQRPATWEFCAAIARALGERTDTLFILAGLKPAPPPAVAEEEEVIRILRELSHSARDTVLTMLRALVERPTAIVAEDREFYHLRTALEEELLHEFRNLPEVWRTEAVEEVRRLHRLHTQYIGDNDDEETSPHEEETAA